MRSKFFIEGPELEDLLKSPPADLKLVNGTYHLPPEGIDPAVEHAKLRLTKDAVFFDHDAIVAPGSTLPHTLPPLDVFKQHMIRLGIQRNQ